MAYDQGNYQQPQRPYNGRAAQRPGPPQGFNQPPPPQQQQYPPQQQYDQYPQDGYGPNDYDNVNGNGNGYAQDYNDGYQDTNGGGRGNGYPPQNQNYPSQQQQEYYPEPRGGGMQPPRGGRGGPPPQQRGPPMDDRTRGGYDQRGGPQGGRGGPPPRQRPPMDDRAYDQRGADPRGGGFDQRGGRPGPGPGPGPGPAPQRAPMNDGMRGGSDQRGGQGGYQNGGPVGRGGGRAPPERSYTADSGSSQQARRPLKTPPMSPDTQSWDNPFPTFPGAKKKTSIDEEQKIIQKMEGMNVNESPQARPGTAQSKHSQGGYAAPGRAATYDDYGNGRPSVESQRRPAPADDYGRASGERQRPAQNGYAQEPAQNYSAPQRGPPQMGSNAPRNDAYWDDGPANGDNFGPPSRSNTMPSEQPAPMGYQQAPRTMEGVGSSAPYNGPVGRNMPPRPSTATGSRPPPQRHYPAPIPIAPQHNYIDQYEEPGRHTRQNESISDLYDSYYDDPDPQRSQGRDSGHSEMPNYNATPNNQSSHRRGASIDAHVATGPVQQQGGYQRPVQNQADQRALMQPQAAVFDTASDGQRTPTNAFFQQNQNQNQYDDYGPPDPRYNQQNGDQYNQNQNQNQSQNQNQRPPMQGGYTEPAQNTFQPPLNSFQPPPRSTSAAPRMGQGFNGAPAPNGGPKPGMNGLPNGPPNGVNGSPNGPQNGMPRNNSAGSANNLPKSKLSEDALPNHPAPVRPGLIPGSVAAQNANTKPAPVRHYNGNPNAVNTPVQDPAPQQPAPTGPQPVTIGELEMIKAAYKAKPNDAAIQMHLIKKLVEASDVLVNTYPDVRMRNKMREKYVMDASKMLKRMVAAGNTDAMFFLADCYGRGALGLENNDKEAFTLYQNAAKAGNAAAAYRTAVCCELGNEEGGGTRKDPLKAIQWYKRAATLGDTPAMYKMGMIQLKGLLGTPANPREAVTWLKRAAERADAENPHALHELGLLFDAPQSADGAIVRDEKYSFSLFKQAAELGYKFSQFKMGCAYEYGLFGCAIDPRQSIAWYSRAAVQEEHQAELALSGWYLTGSEGVLQQSDTEAYLWARKAAMAGNAKAEYAMGYFTEVGIGSPSSLEDAKRWYWKAAAQNFPKARERLEDLKKNGGKGGMKTRERISRSKVGKQNEGECAVM